MSFYQPDPEGGYQDHDLGHNVRYSNPGHITREPSQHSHQERPRDPFDEDEDEDDEEEEVYLRYTVPPRRRNATRRTDADSSHRREARRLLYSPYLEDHTAVRRQLSFSSLAPEVLPRPPARSQTEPCWWPPPGAGGPDAHARRAATLDEIRAAAAPDGGDARAYEEYWRRGGTLAGNVYLAMGEGSGAGGGGGGGGPPSPPWFASDAHSAYSWQTGDDLASSPPSPRPRYGSVPQHRVHIQQAPQYHHQQAQMDFVDGGMGVDVRPGVARQVSILDRRDIQAQPGYNPYEPSPLASRASSFRSAG